MTTSLPERLKPETRAQRGLALYRERENEIVFYPTTGEYGVPSRTEEGELYVVDLEEGSCSCPDATCRKVSCLHMVAAEAKRVGLARKAAAPRRSRCSSLPPMAVRSKTARDFLARTGA